MVLHDLLFNEGYEVLQVAHILEQEVDEVIMDDEGVVTHLPHVFHDEVVVHDIFHQFYKILQP